MGLPSCFRSFWTHCLVFSALLATGVLFQTAEARYIPQIELSDDFYSELRNLMREHTARKQAARAVHPRFVRSWLAAAGSSIGQVSGISVNPVGNPVIFHRGPRIWTASAFNATHHFQGSPDSPIEVDTILELDSETGQIRASWGGGMFQLPHGLTVDREGNVWVTDVALHQVFKFPPDSDRPSLTLGEAFIPGGDVNHFCKPTSVAVSSSGIFFVADGYCNNRVMQFSASGIPLRSFGSQENVQMKIPHSLSLLEERDMLCVADRENRRILCVRAGLRDPSNYGELLRILSAPRSGKIYGIAVAQDDLIYAISTAGPDEETGQGYTFDLLREGALDEWGPPEGFEQPHAIALSPDQSSFYVSEIGPNRIWKFVTEPVEDANALKMEGRY